MNELVFSKFDSGEIIGLVAVGGGILCGLVCGVLGLFLGFYAQAQKTRQVEILAALKQDMLARGMSADEIRRVLEAGGTVSRKERWLRHSCNA
jgi:hypothetical protein